MPRDVVRVAAATLQVGLGLLAVLTCAFAAVHVVDPSSADTGQVLLVGVVLLLGVPLFAVWVAARTSPRWLWVLGGACAALLIAMTVVTVMQVGSARADARLGLWTVVWASAMDAVLWLVVLVATVVEVRQLRRSEDVASPGWAYAAAIIVPLALVVAIPFVVVTASTSWMVRMNGDVSLLRPTATPTSSVLSGRVRWQRDLAAGTDAIATKGGLAVPVPGDDDDSAGVLMLDPGTGATRWRYQLRGVDDPPDLAPTDDGRGIVVSFDPGDLADDIPHATYTLDAENGRVQAFWPDSEELQGTDPPVLFDHVARDTNSVIAISPAGKKLWTYKPERCADPRSVTSTPTVMLVRAEQCGEDRGMQILGLDSRTGERRWTQPSLGDGDSSSGTLVVDAGHQLEQEGVRLRSRRLDTGAISWTAPTPNQCNQPRYLASAPRTVFLGRCDDRTVNEPTSLVAYAASSGERLWRRGVQPAISFTAVDDRGVLALTRGRRTCDVQLLRRASTRTLLTLPDDDQTESGGVRCADAAVLEVDDVFLLRLQLAADGGAETRYRFVALS